MMKLMTFWDSIRSSYWFVPVVMTIGAIMLSTGTLALDTALGPVGSHPTIWLYMGEAEGARTLLAMLAASMLTIFGVVFSILIVALTLASSQFGPRLIRTFLSDTADQLAVGTFIGTFVYCLLVLRTVRGESGETFVPHVSVTVALMLALVSLGVLIYFINHLSISLQASYIIAAVGADLERTIDREFVRPSQAAGSLAAETARSLAAETARTNASGESVDAFATATFPLQGMSRGYVQAIDYAQLAGIASRHNLMMRVCVCPGDFVVRGDQIALLSVAGQPPDGLEGACNAALVLGIDRTHEQDPEFPINQLVQLAIRALSPAINDPITAMMAIEQLRAGLCHIAERTPPSSLVSDEEGVARLLVKRQDPSHITEAAFSLIRQYGHGNVEVCLSLLNAIEHIARRTSDEAFRRALLQQATLIEHGAQSALSEVADRKRVAERFQSVVDVLKCGAGKA